jgi:hypothetical protein
MQTNFEKGKADNMVNGTTRRRNPLLPWWIGLVIIAVAVVYVGYQFTTLNCGPATAGSLAFIVLGVIPAVYLSLMYMTLKSQAASESG